MPSGSSPSDVRRVVGHRVLVRDPARGVVVLRSGVVYASGLLTVPADRPAGPHDQVPILCSAVAVARRSSASAVHTPRTQHPTKRRAPRCALRGAVVLVALVDLTQGAVLAVAVDLCKVS